MPALVGQVRPVDVAFMCMSRNVRLFIDFDGTITTTDVGDELFRTFGALEPAHSELMSGKMSVAQYYILACSTLRSDCTPETLDAFARSQEVDANFVSLLDWCRASGIDVTVVSDGFDAYIIPILTAANVMPLNVHCNRLSYSNSRWTPTFPMASESCQCFCASCKRNVLLQDAAPADVIVYVGDGLSDTCAAEHADVVFAKGALAAHCATNGVAHHQFHTLFDVLAILQARHRKGDFRPRLQAERMRKRAVEAE